MIKNFVSKRRLHGSSLSLRFGTRGSFFGQMEDPSALHRGPSPRFSKEKRLPAPDYHGRQLPNVWCLFR